jgi:hypothetical protein
MELIRLVGILVGACLVLLSTIFFIDGSFKALFGKRLPMLTRFSRLGSSEFDAWERKDWRRNGRAIVSFGWYICVAGLFLIIWATTSKLPPL